MRIAIAGNFSLTGKQTMALRALPMAQKLAERGHSVFMALPLRGGDFQGGPGDIGGVRIRYAGRGPRVPGLVQLWQVLALTAYCRRWRPDVVYCFKPIAHSWGVLSLFWLLRRLGVYRGSIALDTDDWEGDGGWNELQPFPRWLKKLVSWQERWSLRHADAVTVASRALVGLVKRTGATRVVYVPNAVSESSPGLAPASGASVREELNLGSRPVVLIYTRFVEFSVERLLSSFEAILRRVGESVLLVVGKGLGGEELQLQREASRRGLGDHIVSAGWVAKEKLPDYFRAADVALYPLDDTLLNRSKCPVKLLDLLSAGVPVVADAVGQAAEYVENDRTGILVEPGDYLAMGEAAAALLENPLRRREMGDAAAREVRVRWSWDVWVEEVERALGAV